MSVDALQGAVLVVEDIAFFQKGHCFYRCPISYSAIGVSHRQHRALREMLQLTMLSAAVPYWGSGT